MNKEDLLSKFEQRKSQYTKVRVKGAFFFHQGLYYPIKLLFKPIGEKEEITGKELDYGNLLLVEFYIELDQLTNLVSNLSPEKETDFPISSRIMKIPKGLFRYPDDHSQEKELKEILGSWGLLQDEVRRMLMENRSYPKTTFRVWPSKMYLYQFNAENLKNDYHTKANIPLLKKDLPVFSSYDDALLWWLSKEMWLIPEWSIIFILPDFRARIKSVKSHKDSFTIEIEEGILSKSELKSKFYIEYEDITSEVGDTSFASGETQKIRLRDTLRKFYFVLSDHRDISCSVDYRNYWFGGYGKEIDIEYEEEDVEYLLSRGEDEKTEYKLDLDTDSAKKEFLETICSFSNTDGGVILVGVDNNANVKGVDNIKVCREKVGKLVRDWIEPEVKMKTRIVEVQGKQVLTIIVSKGESPPYNYKKHGIYIRANSTDQVVTHDELLSLVRKRRTLQP